MVDLHPATRLRAAAWVPDDDPERPWCEAADLAAGWIWERSRIEGVKPCLATNTFQNGNGIESPDEIARAGGWNTPRSKERFSGPVLAYAPNERTVKLALDLARGHSLVIVETMRFPLAEWAAAARAINLLDGSTESSSLTDDVKKDLGRAVFFGGNNGWTAPYEKKHARDLSCGSRPGRPSHTGAGRLPRHGQGRLRQGSQTAATAPGEGWVRSRLQERTEPPPQRWSGHEDAVPDPGAAHRESVSDD